MENKWSYVPLGDLISLQRGHDLPSQNRINGSVPIMGSSGITGFHNEVKCLGPGVVVGRSGDSMGVVSYINCDYWPLNTCLYVTDFKGNDVRYIYYLLQQINFEQFNSGSAQKSLNRNAVYPFEVYATRDKFLQKKIGEFIFKFEEKITLNRQINQTLEQMAQTLFKSWFVDFDPVIDNALDAGNEIPEVLQTRAELRQKVRASQDFQPLPADVRALFPAEFEFDDRVGWTAQGWSILQIKDIANIFKGISYKSSELIESKTALVTLKSFNRGGGYRLDGLKEYSGNYKPEQVVISGDLVVAYTDVTQAADVIGKPALVIGNQDYDTLVSSLDVAVVRPFEEMHRTYLNGLMQSVEFQNHTHAHTTGTTVLHLGKDAIPDYWFALPNRDLVNGFDTIVKNLYSSINENVSKNMILTSIRDTLLPKLISGELRLDDLPDEVVTAANE